MEHYNRIPKYKPDFKVSAQNTKLFGVEIGSIYIGEGYVLEVCLWTGCFVGCWDAHQQGLGIVSALYWIPNASWGWSMHDQGGWPGVHCHREWKVPVFSCKWKRSKFAYYPAQSSEPAVWCTSPAQEIFHLTETEKWYIIWVDFWREEPIAIWVSSTQTPMLQDFYKNIHWTSRDNGLYTWLKTYISEYSLAWLHCSSTEIQR